MERDATRPVVICRGLTKTYGSGETSTPALRGVDLDVLPGELLMLVGPSGCGKTTLISVIAGILDQDTGSCELFGQDLARLSKRERVRFRGRHIGFVFQAFNLVPCLTALENISVPLLINGVKRDAAQRQAEIQLSRVGLESRRNSLPTQLSGGQQQRVAIARALAHDPGLVVCDEPTSALDHETGTRVLDMLKSLAVKDNRALVIVTHDSRIFQYADRIAHMDDGTIMETSLQNGHNAKHPSGSSVAT
ncbi:ABC transporter ATP-binding protein [Desulfolutivibrio sulfoxidireducens]|uniref:ABC transporter ATP-binding protein n=1 Tax=Desulfolutivibrio sulfoxidireducens TaxID=2773299 RepID=UPI00159E8D71|nr:ABC transporter ATP-binding protein [Desulfolutivibrio sulfoxidireducens]QLA16541.1 ATP-binding cassette domain-containing protein [Desulfolutivibrio sulfoxidireducens]QLA19577.1 ATP-binding cassette domain-containing protein [Desulfolutivibrio sulfoxidireducens]